MELYFIKSGVALIILYLSYRILFRNSIGHQQKRFLGLFCIMFSAILPFLAFESHSVIQEATAVHFIETITEELPVVISERVSDRKTYNIFLLIYIIGACLFTMRFLYAIIKLLRFYIQGKKSRKWGFRVVTLPGASPPFTFFNILFIGSDVIKEDGLELIIAHEQYHRSQWHSIDSLLLEFMSILFWFNPAIWLFKRDIKSEHEFMADKQVLRLGFNMLEYQHLLFRSSTGVSVGLGNNLINQISLTKRFKMMKQVSVKSRNVYYRVGLQLSLVVMVFLFTAFKSADNQIVSVDTEAVYEQGEAEMYRHIRTKIKHPAEARKNASVGRVVVSFVVSENGAVNSVRAKEQNGTKLKDMVVVGYKANSDQVVKTTGIGKILEDEAIRTVKTLGKFTPAQKAGKPVKSTLNISFEFKLK